MALVFFEQKLGWHLSIAVFFSGAMALSGASGLVPWGWCLTLALLVSLCAAVHERSGALVRRRELLAHLDALTGGDVESLPPAAGAWGNALHGLASRMREMLREQALMLGDAQSFGKGLRKTSEALQRSSSMLSEANETLCESSSTIAAGVEEISASLREVASKAKSNADVATVATKLASEGNQTSQEGKRQLDSLIVGVESMRESAGAMGSFVKSIEDIAFQTNLLALNATVEAAHAGKHGRGFSIVAGEVRALAEKSNSALREIQLLIENLTSHSENVHSQARKVDSAFGRIQKLNVELDALSREIDESSHTQGRALQVLESSLEQIETATLRSSATAGECAAAAQVLSGSSSEMAGLIESEPEDFMKWQDSWSVGVTHMDDEHKRLVAIINRLFAAIARGKGDALVTSVLDELVEYTRTHFQHEEELLAKHGYPKLEEQRRLHATFVNKVSGFSQQIRSNSNVASVDLLNLLKAWLLNHILKRDREYMGFLNSRGVH